MYQQIKDLEINDYSGLSRWVWCDHNYRSKRKVSAEEWMRLIECEQDRTCWL